MLELQVPVVGFNALQCLLEKIVLVVWFQLSDKMYINWTQHCASWSFKIYFQVFRPAAKRIVSIETDLLIFCCCNAWNHLQKSHDLT